MKDLIHTSFYKLKSSLHHVETSVNSFMTSGKAIATSPEVWQWLLQTLGILAVLVGISMWSIPCALIVGGLAAVLAIELQTRKTAEVLESPEEARKIKAAIDACLAKGVNPFNDTMGIPMTTRWMTYVALNRKQ